MRSMIGHVASGESGVEGEQAKTGTPNGSLARMSEETVVEIADRLAPEAQETASRLDTQLLMLAFETALGGTATGRGDEAADQDEHAMLTHPSGDWMLH